MGQRFLTLPIIYWNFLVFFWSRVPLITWPSTLLIPNLNSDARRSLWRAKITWFTLATLTPNSNSDARRSQFSTRGYHVTYIRDVRRSHDFHSSSAAQTRQTGCTPVPATQSIDVDRSVRAHRWAFSFANLVMSFRFKPLLFCIPNEGIAIAIKHWSHGKTPFLD